MSCIEQFPTSADIVLYNDMSHIIESVNITSSILKVYSERLSDNEHYAMDVILYNSIGSTISRRIANISELMH